MAKNKTGKLVNCKQCGKETYKPQCRLKENNFCSEECRKQGHHTGRRKTGRMIKCNQCGKQIYKPKNQIKNNNFCSSACQNKWQSRYKTEHTCIICKNKFQWSPSRHKSHNIKYCSITCRDKDPIRYEQIIKRHANQQLQKINKLEIKGYTLLSELKLDFIKQHTIKNKFIVDAFLPAFNIIIQFDGNYWHGNPTLFSTFNKIQLKRMKLDISQDAYMKKCGYKVLRFWEYDIHKNADKVKEEISRNLV